MMSNKSQKKIDKEIDLLFNTLEGLGLIKGIFPTTSFFNDEPKIFLYKGTFGNLNNILTKPEHIFHNNNIYTAGISFDSKREALLKCLGEGIERICLFCHRKEDIYHDRSNFLKNSVNLENYISSNKDGSKKIGWVKGYNLTTNSAAFIPAQLIYLNYLSHNKEIILSPNISTGGACGLDNISAILRGIYEVVERDALMTIYLNKITVPRINLSNINNNQVKEISDRFERYRLEWFVFDFSHDLNIPVMVSILVDKTNYGPAISIGVKCGFNKIKNIIGSAEEAMMVRSSTRILIEGMFLNKKPKSLGHHDSMVYTRSSFWWATKMLKKLNFLLKAPKTNLEKDHLFDDKNKELEFVIEALKNKGHLVYYKDIILDNFKQKGIFVIKAIIPGLQPLYLNDNSKKIIKKRVETVAKYYGKKNFYINNISHPFL